MQKWPKMTKNSVCCALYLRIHTSYDLYLWYTCVPFSCVPSARDFLYIFQILILGLVSRVKGQKMAQNDKKNVCHTLYLRNHTSYDHHLWCT